MSNSPAEHRARGARLPREERRAHLLDVAADIVLDKGADAVTMEGVAAAAGVSKGLGYVYFQNRGELLLALLERELTALEERSQRDIRAAGSFEERIRAAVRAWFDTVAERGALLERLLRADVLHGVLDERRDRYNRALEERWGRLAERELGVPRRTAVVAASILLAGLSGVLERWVDARDPRRLLEDTYVALALRGLEGLAREDR